jgi:hypothetical protein
MKPTLAEPDDFRVARAAYRSQEVQVGDGLEKVRLSLSVVPDQRDPVYRDREIGVSEISKITRLETAKPVVRVPILRA